MSVGRVLGIDPGTRVAGWAVLEQRAGDCPQCLESGILRLGRSPESIPDRLLRLRQGVQEIVAIWKPRMLAIEAAFFGRNARSALRLGEARGAVLVTAQESGLLIRELPPAQVKRRIAGAGAASKEQVAKMVALQLDLREDFESEDESDAMAVALCALIEEEGQDRVPRVLPAEFRGRRGGRPPGAVEQ